MHARLDEYLTLLNTMAAKHYNWTDNPPQFLAEKGRKYTKVVLVDEHHRSVHSFVDKDGNVYKAASWAQPAKGVRYNLDRDMLQLETTVDPYGSYLYNR